ncbi:MAG: hypothetical protein PWP08_1486 [Methanofollis sp.]|nr:hypothetical protein [Methanofollis sp.]
MKKIPVRTRSFGAEAGVPEADDLAGMMSARRGIGGDLLSFQIERSLAFQEGVDLPCAGGIFCGERLLECLTGVEGRRVIGEIGVDPSAVLEDVGLLARQRRGVWFALPAPSLLGLEDACYGDPDEMEEGVIRAFRLLIREMRDAGAGGHVLISESAVDAELEGLAGKKVVFFPTVRDAPCLEAILECQDILPLDPEALSRLETLTDSYEVRELSLMHPTHGDLAAAAAYFDPEEITAGGYTAEGEEDRWPLLRAEAYILR